MILLLYFIYHHSIVAHLMALNIVHAKVTIGNVYHCWASVSPRLLQCSLLVTWRHDSSRSLLLALVIKKPLPLQLSSYGYNVWSCEIKVKVLNAVWMQMVYGPYVRIDKTVN